MQTAVRSDRTQPRKTLRELLAGSGVQVAADLANQYQDGELEASHVALEEQARWWRGGFQDGSFVGAGL